MSRPPLPQDYIMDLHQATRFSVVQSEVDALYGTKFQVKSLATAERVGGGGGGG